MHLRPLGRPTDAASPRPLAYAVAALTGLSLLARQVRGRAGARRLARLDDVTGLANRQAFLADLDARLVADVLKPRAMLLLNLDRFKEVNDALGHHFGDQLLKDLGARLRQAVPRGAVLARRGGDEFAVLLEAGDCHRAGAVADVVLRMTAQPFLLDGQLVRVDASVGVSRSPAQAADPAGLLRQAELAMHQAKGAGGGVRFYHPSQDRRDNERLLSAGQLRTAISGGELAVLYQPQVGLSDGRVSGMEALVRWQHPQRGLLTPDRFLPLAERTGLIRELSMAVLDQAVRQAASWHRDGRDLSVSVNLSTVNLMYTDLPPLVASTLGRHGLPARLLVIEITETAIMVDVARSQAVLRQLRALGVRISIDDYGTGYSSLAYLQRLELDELKLDRAFVGQLGVDVRTRIIVEHSIELAHALGIEVLAEGVEDAATVSTLRALGCDTVQGFWIGLPMTPTDLLTWVDSREPVAVAGPTGA